MVKKYKELFLYVIVGALTTGVNFITYYVLSRTFVVDKLISNLLAFIVSVCFAYIMDKVFVFRATNFALAKVIKEFFAFVLARLFSGAIDMFMFFLLCTKIGINDMITKIIIGVVVTILNYLFSKLYIFKKEKTAK